MLWSGGLAHGGDGSTPDGLSPEQGPCNWGAAAWAALDAAVQRWVAAGRGSSLLIRTHASHIVSDAPSATRFARMWTDHGVRLVYDLASMIAPAMVGTPGLANLYERWVDAMRNPELAGGIACVLVSNVRATGPVLLQVPIDDGVIAPALISTALPVAAELGIAVATLDTEPHACAPPA